MKDFTAVVHDDYVDEVIDSLHQSGVAEISDIDRDKEVFDRVEPSGIPAIITRLTDYEIKLSNVLDVFSRFEEERSAVQEFLNPIETKKVKRESRELKELLKEIDTVFEKHGNRVVKLDEKLGNIEEELQNLEELKKDLTLLKEFELELSHIGESDWTDIRVGTTTSPLKFKEAVSDIKSEFHTIKKVTEDKYIVIAGAFIREKTEFESALRQGDVRPFDLENLTGHPKEALEKIKDKIGDLKEKKERIEDTLAKMKDEHEKEYKVLEEELNIYRQKREITQRFGTTEETSVVKGWVAEKNEDKVEKIVEKSSNGCAAFMTEEPKDEDLDEVPIELDNPKLIRPYELLTNMFAPPKYDEIDPTFILAPAFVLFFGLMLGDAVYGLLIILTSALILQGIGKVEEGTRDFALLLLGTGISTFIFGILQGGFLGPSKPGHPNLLGRLGMGYNAPLETLEGQGPLTLLVISLIIGLVYINIGLALAFVQHLNRKDYRNILLENGSWWTLQPGGFILLSGKLFGWFEFSQTHYILAGVLSAIGLLLLVVRAKGLSFFDLTGFIGDFLSFSRILALGLATGGIALTVNVLADLLTAAEMPLPLSLILLVAGSFLLVYSRMKDNMIYLGVGVLLAIMGGLGTIAAFGPLDPSYPFYIVGLFVIIGGHLANAVLQALGSFVHSLRLQYVEFFNYFYEGGGSSFTPFKPEREHTEIEEDVIE